MDFTRSATRVIAVATIYVYAGRGAARRHTSQTEFRQLFDHACYVLAYGTEIMNHDLYRTTGYGTHGPNLLLKSFIVPN